MDDDPTKNFTDAVECVKEAATLHLKIGNESTRKAVASAMIWRYGISEYAAGACYDAALQLIDAMPRGPRA